MNFLPHKVALVHSRSPLLIILFSDSRNGLFQVCSSDTKWSWGLLLFNLGCLLLLVGVFNSIDFITWNNVFWQSFKQFLI